MHAEDASDADTNADGAADGEGNNAGEGDTRKEASELGDTKVDAQQQKLPLSSSLAAVLAQEQKMQASHLEGEQHGPALHEKAQVGKDGKPFPGRETVPTDLLRLQYPFLAADGISLRDPNRQRKRKANPEPLNRQLQGGMVSSKPFSLLTKNGKKRGRPFGIKRLKAEAEAAAAAPRVRPTSAMSTPQSVISSYDASPRQQQAAPAQSQGPPPSHRPVVGGTPSFQSCKDDAPAAAADAQGKRTDGGPPGAVLLPKVSSGFLEDVLLKDAKDKYGYLDASRDPPSANKEA